MARPEKDKELNDRIRKAWATGRYKTHSALARIFRTYPNKITRAVRKQEELKEV